MPFVYLIEEIPFQNGESGPWTKIGFSINDPAWRMNANLRMGNPRQIRVAAQYSFDSGEEAKLAERAAHAHFGSALHQKEWFRLPWQTIDEWMLKKGFVSAKPDDRRRRPRALFS